MFGTCTGYRNAVNGKLLCVQSCLELHVTQVPSWLALAVTVHTYKSVFTRVTTSNRVLQINEV